MPPPFRRDEAEPIYQAMTKRDIAGRARRLRRFLRDLEANPPVDDRWMTATNRLWHWSHGDRTAKWAYYTDRFLEVAAQEKGADAPT